MDYRFAVGDRVMWSGAWGTRAPRPARIVYRGVENDEPVYDLNNGHWAYEYQLEAAADAVEER